MRPPRLARAILTRAVPPDDSGRTIIADLDLEFAERGVRDGPSTASRWYWRQAWSLWWWSALAHPPNSHHHPRGDLMSNLIGDFRYAGRLAMRFPGQSALIVATLAIGIGITTLGFAFADTAFVRGLPIAEPSRTVIIYGLDSREPERRGGVYISDVLALRERSRSVEDLSTWAQSRATFRRQGSDPLRVTVAHVTGDLFAVWGTRTQIGRPLARSDAVVGAPPVAVVADRFWRESLAADPNVVGSSVIIDNLPVSIVGVLGPEIEVGTFANIALWRARPVEAAQRELDMVMLTGRLAADATVEEAAAEFRVLADALAQEHPDSNRGRQLLVLSARRAIGGPNFAIVLSLLVGAAVLVTVIASVNVAGVLLARAVVRRQEFALRAALGAANTRLFRQVTIEGMLLALISGAGGLAVAELGLRLIRSVEAEPIFQQIVIDWHELAFVGMLAILAPLLFSLAPAFASTRLDLIAALNAAGARTSHTHSRRTRDLLVISQLGLAIALAIVGGLVARTVVALTWAPDGFDAGDVLTFTLALDQHSTDATERLHILRSIEQGIRDSSAQAAGAMDALPAVFPEGTIVVHPDGVAPDDRTRAHLAHLVRVDSSALATLGVPVIDGRAFTANDVAHHARVALVTAETATRFYNGTANAVGRRIGVVSNGVVADYQIVGVTGDVRDTDPENGMPSRVWLPLSAPGTVNVVVRTTDAAGTAAAVRRIVRELVPQVPVEAMEMYEAGIARHNGGNQIAMGMLLSFVTVALIFAGTGLYGTVAIATNMRRAEFATRFALGATRRDVIGLVARHTTRLLVFGLVPGVLLGLAIANAMKGLLYGVAPLDPLTLIGVFSLLSIIALLASAAPALRAARMDLIAVLRGN